MRPRQAGLGGTVGTLTRLGLRQPRALTTSGEPPASVARSRVARRILKRDLTVPNRGVRVSGSPGRCQQTEGRVRAGCWHRQKSQSVSLVFRNLTTRVIRM